MPKLIRQTIPHIFIAMFIAPIVLSMFAWAGSEFITNRDTKIAMPHLEKKIDKVISNQNKYFDIVVENSKDISYLKGKIQ